MGKVNEAFRKGLDTYGPIKVNSPDKIEVRPSDRREDAWYVYLKSPNDFQTVGKFTYKDEAMRFAKRIRDEELNQPGLEIDFKEVGLQAPKESNLRERIGSIRSRLRKLAEQEVDVLGATEVSNSVWIVRLSVDGEEKEVQVNGDNRAEAVSRAKQQADGSGSEMEERIREQFANGSLGKEEIAKEIASELSIATYEQVLEIINWIAEHPQVVSMFTSLFADKEYEQAQN